MSAIASIQHNRFRVIRQKFGNSRPLVPNDNDIDFHGFDIFEGVQQRLAFFDAGIGTRKIHDVRRKAFFRQFKACPRPSAVFKKQIHDGHAPKRGHFFNRPFQQLAKFDGGIQNRANILFADALKP